MRFYMFDWSEDRDVFGSIVREKFNQKNAFLGCMEMASHGLVPSVYGVGRKGTGFNDELPSDWPLGFCEYPVMSLCHRRFLDPMYEGEANIEGITGFYNFGIRYQDLRVKLFSEIYDFAEKNGLALVRDANISYKNDLFEDINLGMLDSGCYFASVVDTRDLGKEVFEMCNYVFKVFSVADDLTYASTGEYGSDENGVYVKLCEGGTVVGAVRKLLSVGKGAMVDRARALIDSGKPFYVVTGKDGFSYGNTALVSVFEEGKCMVPYVGVPACNMYGFPGEWVTTEKFDGKKVYLYGGDSDSTSIMSDKPVISVVFTD